MSSRRRDRSRSPTRGCRSPTRDEGNKVLVYRGTTNPSDRSRLISEGLVVYDNMYPFRKAAQFIVNAEHHSRGRSTPQEIERFAEYLALATNRYQGDMFPYLHFMEWIRGQRKGQRIVVVSITDEESFESLKKRGATLFDGEVQDIPRAMCRCADFES